MTVLCWVLTGDSIAGSAGRWPYQYLGVTSKGQSGLVTTMAQAVYTVGNIIFKNLAVAGLGLQTNPTDIAPDVGPHYADPIFASKTVFPVSAAGTVSPTRRKYLYMCGIGTNDSVLLDGAAGSATPYANAVAANAQLRRTAGADIIALCTVLPRATIMIEANRLEFNSNLTNSSWRLAHGIDYVVDLAGEATMGNPTNTSNTTYYSDGLHPTDLGSGLLATNQVTPVMNTILASI